MRERNIEIPQFRIEGSAMQYGISQNILEAIGETGLLEVSGRPLFIMGSEKDLFYNDTSIILDVPLIVRSIRMFHMPEVGHSHLEKSFIGSYPTLAGTHLNSGDDYVFGIRPELYFDWCDLSIKE